MNSFITEVEVSEAIKDLNVDKTPGDDGISAEFYQTFNLKSAPILAELYNNKWLRSYDNPNEKWDSTTYLQEKRNPLN